MVMLLATMMITRRATTRTAIRAGSTRIPFLGMSSILQRAVRPGHPLDARVTPMRSLEGIADDGRGALDLQDPDRLPDGERLALVLAAGAPLVAAQADPPAVPVDGLGHPGGLADDHVDPVELQRGALDQVLLGDGPDDGEQGER